jgi:hypothetical protein
LAGGGLLGETYCPTLLITNSLQALLTDPSTRQDFRDQEWELLIPSLFHHFIDYWSLHNPLLVPSNTSSKVSLFRRDPVDLTHTSSGGSDELQVYIVL